MACDHALQIRKEEEEDEMRREGFLSLRPALIVSFDSRKEGAHRLQLEEEVTRKETPKLSVTRTTKTHGFFSSSIVVVSDPQ